MVVLVSSIGPSVNAQILTPPVQHSYLAFTVQPDRSIRVGWNTTTTLPNSTLPKNVTSVFPPGYAIHSTSAFSQQSNAVVETTTTQYTLPQAVISQSQGILNYVSINLTSTQTGTSGQGTLRIDTTPSAILPISNVLVSFTNDLSSVDITAAAQVHFYSSLTGSFLENQTAFQSEWTKTFGNSTWTNLMISQVQNSTRILTVTAFSGSLGSINSSSAAISIHFHAVANTPTPPNDFISAFEQRFNVTIPAAIDSLIRQLLALSTSQTLSLAYTGSTNVVTIKTTTNFVVDLDAKLNSIKSQFFTFLLGNLPYGTPVPPAISFIQSTDIAVSQMSMTSDLDLNASTDRTTLQGLILKPPTVGPNNNFTIPGLFQTLGLAPQSSLDIKLIDGSNSSYTVKIVVPSGTTQPTSTTTNSASWTNVQNATTLQNVRFKLVPTSTSLLDILTSPTALIVEGIAAVAIASGFVLLMRRKRAAVPALTPVMGPAPTPGPSPAPAPSPAPPNP